MNLGTSGTSRSVPSLDANQHALRKAGEEFFEQFLEQARKGRNVLDADPRTRRKPDLEIGDAADLETVGRVLPYVYGAMYFASASARLVVAKQALEALSAPGAQVFLHLLPGICLSAAFVDIGPIEGKAWRACSVQVLMQALQIISLFGALNFCSLYLVLAWTVLAPPALSYNWRMMRARGTKPGLLNAIFIAVGLSGSALTALQRMWPSLLGLLCLLGWAAGELLKILWEEFKEDPEEALVMSPGIRGKLKDVAEGEEKAAPGAAVFHAAAFTAVLALFTGLICGEGNKLVDHELSVPAVSSILISCTAWAACTLTSCLHFAQTPGQAVQRLTAFTSVPAIILQVLLHGVGDPVKLSAASLAVLGGMCAQQYR